MKIGKTARINIVLILVTFIITAATSLPSFAASGWEALGKSKGKIVYTNNTADTSDDVIFDATDFQKLYDVCK